MISVLMPVYNNIEYLKVSIDSILNQTYEDFEFIIIDDKSTDPVWDLLHSYNDSRIVKIRNKENVGLTKSLNICLDMAKGDFIARHDSDDISLPTRFEDEIKLFYGNIGLVSCYGYRFNESGRITYDDYLENKIKITEEEIKNKIKYENCILGAGSIFTRKVFEKIGYYDEEFYVSQDYNYWIRILKYFDVKICRKELYAIRKHRKSVRTLRQDKSRGMMNKYKLSINEICQKRANVAPIIKTIKVEHKNVRQ